MGGDNNKVNTFQEKELYTQCFEIKTKQIIYYTGTLPCWRGELHPLRKGKTTLLTNYCHFVKHYEVSFDTGEIQDYARAEHSPYSPKWLFLIFYTQSSSQGSGDSLRKYCRIASHFIERGVSKVSWLLENNPVSRV